MAEMSDYRAFGNLLCRARQTCGKTPKELREELGTGNFSTWEKGSLLPGRDKLPLIAVVYKIPLDKLTAAYETAKEARQMEKKARRAS